MKDYTPENNVLKDRIILVTGASDGIGRVASKTLAAYGATVIESADGGYLMLGGSGGGSGNRDFYLVKAGPQGVVDWTQTYGHGDLDYDWGSALSGLEDGGAVLVGNHTHTDHGALMDVFLVKIDASGEEVWRETLTQNGVFDTASAISRADDGGFVIAGATKNGIAVSDAYIIKTDSEGKPLWNVHFGGQESDRAEALIQTADGGYVVVGQSRSFGAGAYDVWVIKIGPEL